MTRSHLEPPAKPRPVPAPPVPVVVGSSREERARRAGRRELRRGAVALVVALAAHAALVFWLAPWKGSPDHTRAAVPVRSSIEDLPEHDAPPPPPPEDELEPPPPTPPEELDVEQDDVFDDEPSSGDDSLVRDAQDILGLGGADGGGRGGRRSGLALGELDALATGPGSAPFQSFVQKLRAQGLDLAFVVDATASMDAFIVQARTTIDAIIADLAAVVPDLRLGVVAYRDRKDDWLTRHVDLTDDRYLVHNFLADLEASGGGDFEEAVEEGLRVAADTLSWRPGTRRVLILVGDAPPHAADMGSALGAVRGFTRVGDAAVSALFTGAAQGGVETDTQKDARKAFESIARMGGGLLEDLGTTSEALRDRILDASFGKQWRVEIRTLLSQRGPDDVRQRVVASRVRSRDTRWLLSTLGSLPVHPALVEGCVRLFDGAFAQRALELLRDEAKPQAVRSAALHVLKRGIDGDRAPGQVPRVSVDVTRPLAEQAAALAKISREVEKLARRSPPPPAPRAAPAPERLPPP